jgi:hypothetical protein
LSHNPHISFVPLIRLLLILPFTSIAHGQSTRVPDSLGKFHSNFGLIQRIKVPRESTSEVFALQTEATTEEILPDGRGWEQPTGKKGETPQPAEVLPVGENELSEEEIKKMLFGDNVIEEEPQPVEELAEKKKWIPSFSGKFGIGYSDNPMYGPYIREGSAYAELESEVFLLRQGSPNYLTYLYLFGEGKRFEGLPEYDLSGILLAQAEHTYVSDDSTNSFGVRLRHTYYDQAFDFSDLGLPYSMQVQSNKSEIIPHLSHRFSQSTIGKLEVSGGNERFDDPSENNEDRQFRASLEWQATEKLSLEGKVSARWVDYKGRGRRESDGAPLPDGKLETEKLGLALAIEREFSSSWIEALGINLKVDQLEDNAGGSYDYKRRAAGLSYSAKWEKWLLEVDLGWNQFRYDQRTVSSGDRFDRQSFSNQLTLTHVINENWNAYLKWNREEDQSNSRDYEYFSNFYSIGISWEQ